MRRVPVLPGRAGTLSKAGATSRRQIVAGRFAGYKVVTRPGATGSDHRSPARRTRRAVGGRVRRRHSEPAIRRRRWLAGRAAAVDGTFSVAGYEALAWTTSSSRAEREAARTSAAARRHVIVPEELTIPPNAGRPGRRAVRRGPGMFGEQTRRRGRAAQLAHGNARPRHAGSRVRSSIRTASS